MTSNSALSQFADLSPEKRQLLFEKIRQKKLNSARRPVNQEPLSAEGNPVHLSPHQATLFPRTADTVSNRLVELSFKGVLQLERLQQKLQQLHAIYPTLGAKLDSTRQQFQVGECPSAELIQLSLDAPDSDSPLSGVRSELQHRQHGHNALHLTLVQQDNQPSRFLLAAHPLLLDSYSLLRLGNQLLAMLFTPVANIELPDQCSQASFANWSQQVLDKKFLANEWSRLAPKSMLEQPEIATSSTSATHTEQLNSEFLLAHLPAGISAKQWLCEAINQCLYSWLSHQDITYWFSDPSLKDSEFENLLGYFPYYVPVQSQKVEGQRFNAASHFANLHTRFSPVSEQLAQSLCQKGSPVPLVHYHWFDVDNADANEFELISAEHISSGLMLAPFEVHIIEQVDNINLSIHFDSDRMGSDQIQFLVRDLLALLKQDTHNDPANRPSLADQLRAIWKDLLQVPDIAPGKSFFELGGHSLQVTEMKFRIKQQLKLDIPISVLYELPTIEKLSSFILATHGNSLGWVPEGQTEEVEEEEGTL